VAFESVHEDGKEEGVFVGLFFSPCLFVQLCCIRGALQTGFVEEQEKFYCGYGWVLVELAKYGITLSLTTFPGVGFYSNPGQKFHEIRGRICHLMT